ncbi:transmembrane amino acid transporter protein-domain-containing protein [Flagelloscypha sp. PMI_526]|nr:transmembrane amino acid transporter protein-domain-containing protein [Flagelloscypha sp. PMI_526]
MSGKVAKEKEASLASEPVNPRDPTIPQDVFVETDDQDFHYKTLSWQFTALFMCAEIVSNGMLSLPSSLAVVGIVPGTILIIFLGAFALYTSILLINFKLNHPNVHNMGDAGYIIGGPVVRELCAGGTIIFAICGVGSELLSGQQALTVLSNGGLCAMHFTLIFAAATFLLAIPRTLDKLSVLGLCSVCLIAVSALIGMVGAGTNPTPSRSLSAAISSDFLTAFVAITNPVFAYAGHFMFFILMSEMKRPEEAIKSAWCLQTFATVFYVVFSLVMYCYIGNDIQSPAYLSLPPKWAKAAFGLGLGNFLLAGGLYSHTAAKLIFVRVYRGTHHIYKHTLLGWTSWIFLCFLAVTIAFVLAVAVPIFSYLIGIAAALFASWFTYGLAGFFYIHDAKMKEGSQGLWQHPVKTCLALFTILAGAFICVAGTYVMIQLIINAYEEDREGSLGGTI